MSGQKNKSDYEIVKEVFTDFLEKNNSEKLLRDMLF